MSTTNNLVSSINGVVRESCKVQSGLFMYKLGVKRNSGYEDIVDVIVPEKNDYMVGACIRVSGFIYSYNYTEAAKTRLGIGVYELASTALSYSSNKNCILFRGTICKPPTLRRTPAGKIICDVIVAVNNYFEDKSVSAYIPCIMWNTTAQVVSELPVGTNLNIIGRLQSRAYDKVIDGVVIKRWAQEVSANHVEVIKDE